MSNSKKKPDTNLPQDPFRAYLLFLRKLAMKEKAPLFIFWISAFLFAGCMLLLDGLFPERTDLFFNTLRSLSALFFGLSVFSLKKLYESPLSKESPSFKEKLAFQERRRISLTIFALLTFALIVLLKPGTLIYSLSTGVYLFVCFLLCDFTLMTREERIWQIKGVPDPRTKTLKDLVKDKEKEDLEKSEDEDIDKQEDVSDQEDVNNNAE